MTMIPDFGGTTEVAPIQFNIDGEPYYAVGETSAGVLLDMGEMLKVEGLGNQISALTVFIQALLLPDSFERLKARLRDNKKSPISFQQLMRIIEYVMERQADRPTQQPSPSSASSTPIVTSSTVGAQVGV
jgi:hypothetical protein